MPKKTLIILFVLFPLVIGLACRFSSKADPTATPTEEPVVKIATEPPVIPTESKSPEKQEETTTPPPVEISQDLVVLNQSNLFQEGSETFIGYLINNPSSDILYEDVEFTVDFYNSAGGLIDSSYTYLPSFYPNTTYGITAFSFQYDEGVTVASAEINWTFSGTSSASASENPFTTDKLRYWENAGNPLVTGKIVNNSSTTYTKLTANILCFGDDDHIVGGGSAYLDFIHLNDYAGFITYVDAFDEVARVEAYPTLTYSSKVIDKTDFTSEISIVNENFVYESNMGWFYGGLIMKNETESVLKDNYVQITFYDKDDDIITTGSGYLSALLPGESVGIAPWISTPPDDSIYARYDILLLPGKADAGYELSSNPFKVDSAAISSDSTYEVIVNFTNTYSKQVSDLDVYVLVYNADGKIIGGGDTWVSDPTPAGGSVEVEVWVSYPYSETIASVKAWVIPNYWTSFE
ncbi:MAG TPA: hypothetical protein PK057_01765 [Brevefilum fermentans]|jgi:hypothetical protein|nr:hypothetical protein [Brevefilum fermentans]